MIWTRQLLLGLWMAVVSWIIMFALPAAAQAPRFATVTSAKANIYQEPSEDSPVKQKVKRGTYLEVGSIHGTWVKVRTDGGVVGFILKSDVVPGKKDLGGGAPPPDDSGPKTGGSGGGSNVTVENRLGLLTRAGLQFATDSYSLKASGGFNRAIPAKTVYTGLNAEGEYYFLPYLGAHFRFLDTFGSETATLSPPVDKEVQRIPTNVAAVQFDVLGRYFLGEDPASISINGRLGYHIQEMLVDPVEANSGQPLFTVSQSYKGLVIGAGADVPLGSPSYGLRAGLDYWLAPTLSEGISGASGGVKSASGLDIQLGGYFNFSDTSGMDLGFEYDSFSGTFSGGGNRFDTAITDAKSSDSYILFGLNGTFRF
jgi:hypothetical protein